MHVLALIDGITERYEGSRLSALKFTIKLACAIVVCAFLYHAFKTQVGEIDSAKIWDALRATSPVAILLALICTAVSFAAMSRYDDLALRVLDLKISMNRSMQAGFVATSLGQFFGFGFLVGTFSRWRFYQAQGIPLKQSALISGMVVTGFMFGFAVLFAAAIVIAPSSAAMLSPLAQNVLYIAAWGILALGALLFVSSFTQLRLTIARRAIAAPRWRLLRAQISLAALDTIPAALALWVLLPESAGIGFLTLFPVFLAALGLGLMSNTPGGIGILELSCIAVMPLTSPEEVLAALIMFRVIYFVIPAMVGLALLAAREISDDDAPDEPDTARPAVHRASVVGTLPKAVSDLLAVGQRAEAGLAYAGDKDFLFSPCGQAALMFAKHGNSLIAISDPIGPNAAWPKLIAAFERHAQSQFLSAGYYKASPDFRDRLNEAGNTSLAIGSEAYIDPQTFSLDGSKRRELRRKQSKAHKSGVEIEHCSAGEFAIGQLQSLSQQWQDRKAGTKRFSIGPFDPAYLRNFDMIIARARGSVVGFVSLWRSGDGQEISIDVMRIASDAPDGTMHALMIEAISNAKDQNAQRFSLCAVPFALTGAPVGAGEHGIDWLYKSQNVRHGAQGLFRFKNAFRPEWERRYLVASNMATLGQVAFDTSRLINGKENCRASHMPQKDPALRPVSP